MFDRGLPRRSDAISNSSSSAKLASPELPPRDLRKLGSSRLGRERLAEGGRKAKDEGFISREEPRNRNDALALEESSTFSTSSSQSLSEPRADEGRGGTDNNSSFDVGFGGLNKSSPGLAGVTLTTTGGCIGCLVSSSMRSPPASSRHCTLLLGLAPLRSLSDARL